MNVSKLEDRRVWLAGGTIGALLLVAASWLLVIHPRLSSASSLRAEAASTEQQNATLATQNAELAKKYASIDTLRAKLAAVTEGVPAKSNFPQFTREAYLMAAYLHVDLKQITTAAPTPVVTAVAPTTTDPSTTGSDGSGSSTSASGSTSSGTTTGSSTTGDTSTSSTSSTSSTAGTSGTATGGPSTSSIGVTTGGAATVGSTQYQVPITIQASGPVEKIVTFVGALQRGSRNVLVSSDQMSITGASADATIQLSIFTVPTSTDAARQLRSLLAPTD